MVYIMELLTTNTAVLNEIALTAQKKNIPPMRWIDFCGFVGDLWFKGILTSDQKDLVHKWAWEISGFPCSKEEKRAEQLFGVLKYAYENKSLSW